MKISELLIERVVNAFSPTDKQAWAPQVWDVIQLSYKDVSGGFGSAASVEELIADSGLWKIIARNGKVSAVSVYKDKHGRKSIAGGTDGTPQGKADYRMLRNEDLKMRRAWAEVSGAPEALMKRSGATPLPAKYAAALTGKKILDYDPDGIHYTRLINGYPKPKVIYGSINLTPETQTALQAAGITLHDLPANFLR